MDTINTFASAEKVQTKMPMTFDCESHPIVLLPGTANNQDITRQQHEGEAQGQIILRTPLVGEQPVVSAFSMPKTNIENLQPGAAVPIDCLSMARYLALQRQGLVSRDSLESKPSVPQERMPMKHASTLRPAFPPGFDCSSVRYSQHAFDRIPKRSRYFGPATRFSYRGRYPQSYREVAEVITSLNGSYPGAQMRLNLKYEGTMPPRRPVNSGSSNQTARFNVSSSRTPPYPTRKVAFDPYGTINMKNCGCWPDQNASCVQHDGIAAPPQFIDIPALEHFDDRVRMEDVRAWAESLEEEEFADTEPPSPFDFVFSKKF